ncbi:MAG: hypothetical protein GF317_20230, partial [Candidatus Lokiarchaeota archaeon]|nr:hypothetical protein [Candidatus Lokiarchaeota archaeon]MBD3201816.1 hypothetical protein [Candidatus Lokiarchaeota archaeon]
SHKVKEVPRYTQESNLSSQFSFLAEVPACGYKVYYIKTDKSPREFRMDELDFDLDNYRIENQFYKIIVSKSGKIKLIDKETDEVYEDLCFIEDVGDWGDEYDYSGPKDNQMDIKYTSEDADILSLTQRINGPTQKTLELSLRLKLPSALTEDRYKRENVLVDNYFKIYLSIYDNIKRVDFRIEVQNNSRDHRLRVLFPSKLVASKIFVDGHFYVIPREISLPNGDNWVQKPLPTNHQKDFLALHEDNTSFSITNKGLPEYEAIMNEDGTITIAITLLRCVEWLSRDGFETRGGHAGPQLKTPGAQCIGNHIFELALLTVSNKNGWMDSLIHKKAKEFNNPLLPVFPTMAATPLRFMDKVLVNPTGIMSIYVGNNESNLKRYLPEELSFLELENDKVMLSILKKADNDGDLIIRVYNLSENVETTSLKLFNKLIIKNAQLVNFLEESPKNKIKANIDAIEENKLFLTLKPHVIATLKLEIECKVEK